MLVDVVISMKEHICINKEQGVCQKKGVRYELGFQAPSKTIYRVNGIA